MGNVKKVNDDYYVEFYARGLLYQQKAGKDLKQAEALLREIEEKIAKGELATIVREVDWDIFFQTYRENAFSSLPEITRIRYESTISHFCSFLKTRFRALTKISQLTPRLFEDYSGSLQNQRVSARIINLTIFILRDVMDYAIKLGYLNDNPTIHLKRMKVRGAFPRTLTEGQVQELLRESNGALCSVITVVLSTGCRLSECLALSGRNVDFEKKCITITPSSAGFIGRDVPLTPALYPVLKDLVQKNSGAIFPGLQSKDVLRQFDTLKRQLGFDHHVGFSALRNTFAKDLLKKNVSIFRLQRIFGEADIARMMRYLSFVDVL